MKFCEKCGKELLDEKFCPDCGNEINCITENKEIDENETQENDCNQTEAKTENAVNILLSSKKAIIAGGIVVLAVIIVIIALLNKGPNFKKIFDEYCDPIWAEVGSDKSYLHIDTNPYDEEDNGIAYYASYTAIENVNAELGLPDSLFDDMGKTTGNDGKQTEEFDDIKVSWKYHPDKGLEVTYKKK
ncbi:MAG: zinc ribbon domain-containing protein [Clostridia bacterium]|nr:zinc ribbon domain-containing protein [Clostridia bacterium]